MPKKKLKPNPFRLPPVPLTPGLLARFRALDAPTDTDQPCSVCRQGRGMRKVTIHERLVCHVCSVMLSKLSAVHREWVLRIGVGQMKWAEKRLPYYREWLTSADRANGEQTSNQLVG